MDSLSEIIGSIISGASRTSKAISSRLTTSMIFAMKHGQKVKLRTSIVVSFYTTHGTMFSDLFDLICLRIGCSNGLVFDCVLRDFTQRQNEFRFHTMAEQRMKDATFVC